MRKAHRPNWSERNHKDGHEEEDREEDRKEDHEEAGEEDRLQAQAECGVHEADDAERGARHGGGIKAAAAHRGHQLRVGRAPLEFTLGSGQVIPGFDKAVLGMKIGEKKTFTIPANEAYGPRRDELVLEVPRELLPKDITPQVGQRLQQKGDSGSVITATITKVSEKTVILDANHPLAGKDLTFEIELVKMR